MTFVYILRLRAHLKSICTNVLIRTNVNTERIHVRSYSYTRKHLRAHLLSKRHPCKHTYFSWVRIKCARLSFTLARISVNFGMSPPTEYALLNFSDAILFLKAFDFFENCIHN